MSLTASSIEKKINEKNTETAEISSVEKQFEREVEEMKEALNGMQETGEYDNIISTLHSEVRAEVESKKASEITDKIQNINTELKTTGEDNEQTIGSLGNNIEKASGIRSEVASRANELANNAVAELSVAKSEREDLGTSIAEMIEKATKVRDDASQINV